MVVILFVVSEMHFEIVLHQWQIKVKWMRSSCLDVMQHSLWPQIKQSHIEMSIFLSWTTCDVKLTVKWVSFPLWRAAIHQQHQNTTFLNTNTGKLGLFDGSSELWHMAPPRWCSMCSLIKHTKEQTIKKSGLHRGEQDLALCLGC